MKDNQQHDALLEQRSGRLLDHSLTELPNDVNAQLNIARTNALNHRQHKRPVYWAITCAISVFGLVSMMQYQSDAQAEPINMLSAELTADPQMLEQLAFSYWLSEQALLTIDDEHS